MQDAQVETRTCRKFRLVGVELDKRRRRQWAAAEAREVGWGGISLVSRATGLSLPTIMAGLAELELAPKTRVESATRVLADTWSIKPYQAAFMAALSRRLCYNESQPARKIPNG